jgi:hypothetical protein
MKLRCFLLPKVIVTLRTPSAGNLYFRQSNLLPLKTKQTVSIPVTSNKTLNQWLGKTLTHNYLSPRIVKIDFVDTLHTFLMLRSIGQLKYLQKPIDTLSIKLHTQLSLNLFYSGKDPLDTLLEEHLGAGFKKLKAYFLRLKAQATQLDPTTDVEKEISLHINTSTSNLFTSISVSYTVSGKKVDVPWVKDFLFLPAGVVISSYQNHKDSFNKILEPHYLNELDTRELLLDVQVLLRNEIMKWEQ